MHAMLQTMDSNIILVENDPDDKEIDFEAPLMSLPYLFSTNLNTIPSSKSYLFINHAIKLPHGRNVLQKPHLKLVFAGKVLYYNLKSADLFLYPCLRIYQNYQMLS